jgi:hypothetical protein
MGLVLLLTLALAQEKAVTTTKEKDATVRVAVSGETELDYVWRRKEITAFTGGFDGTSTPGNSRSENTFEGFAAVRLDVDLSDQVFAVAEIGTKRADNGAINVFGQGSALPIKLREAHVLKKELFMTELSLQLGITTWGFDLRGEGQSMAFDLRHSQNFIHNLSGGADGPATLGNHASNPQELEPVGFWLRFARDRFALDLVVLPAVLEGGSPSNDEALYAIDLLYTMDAKGSRFGVILAAVNDPGSHSMIYTYGGGVDWRGIENLEAYVEFYFQNGRNNGTGPGTLEVGAYAFQVGGEYNFTGSLKPWVGINFTTFSGDRDAVANGKASMFNSYSGLNDLLILEDMYYGFDWDTNYRALKISGGISLTAARENDLRLSLIVGLTRSAEPVRFAFETTRKLGNEIDLKADWEMTKQFAFRLGVAYLFGSEILEDSMGGPGAPDAERQTWLYFLGFDLKF